MMLALFSLYRQASRALNAYTRLLGQPWVFERLRPLVVGGVDMSSAYERLGVGPRSVVLDLGCGMGDALRYLGEFASYTGFDTDARAIRVARSRYHARSGVEFVARDCRRSDLTALSPTHVAMVGLLHHLGDEHGLELLDAISLCRSIERVVTLDIVYLSGKWFNNALAFLDRGRHCRSPEGYRRLAERAGLTVMAGDVVPCHPEHGRVDYYVLTLTRGYQSGAPSSGEGRPSR